MLLISGITLLIVRWSMERPIKRMAQWLQDLRAGSTLPNPELPGEEVFKPLTREVTNLAASLKVARASAEEEARLREAADSLWTAERLRVYQHSALEDSRLFVVSNREPYEHVYRGGAVETIVPASSKITTCPRATPLINHAGPMGMDDRPSYSERGARSLAGA